MKKAIVISLLLFFISPLFASNILADKGYKLNEKGNKEFKEKNYKSAVNEYIRALSERDDPVIKFNLANSFYKMKDYDKAIDIYKKIEKQSPDFLKPGLYYNLGNAYFKKKQYDKAVGSYVKCLKLNPKDKYAKQNLEMALKMIQKQKQKQKQKQDKNKDKNKKDKNKQDKNKNQKDKQKKDNNKKNQQKKNEKNKENQKEQAKKRQMKKLLKTLAEQEKIDRKKNMKNKKKQRAVIDRMEKDW